MCTLVLAPSFPSNVHTALPPGDNRLELLVDYLQHVMIEGARVEKQAHN